MDINICVSKTFKSFQVVVVDDQSDNQETIHVYDRTLEDEIRTIGVRSMCVNSTSFHSPFIVV